MDVAVSKQSPNVETSQPVTDAVATDVGASPGTAAAGSEVVNGMLSTESKDEASAAVTDAADTGRAKSRKGGLAKDGEDDFSAASSNEVASDENSDYLREKRQGGRTRARKVGRYLRLMEERTILLEKTIDKLLNKPLPAEVPPKIDTRVPAIPEVRWVKWFAFKNFIAEERRHAIRALVGKPGYLRPGATTDATYEGPADATDLTAESSSDMPERIRIHSRPLLKILEKIEGEGVWDWHSVVFRPYKVLVDREVEIKAKLAELDKKWESTTPQEVDLRESIPESEEITTDSLEARNDLRCLVRLMDEKILPVSKRLADGTAKKVSFDNLWYLFRPGQTVCAPSGNQAAEVRNASVIAGLPATGRMYQRAWTVVSVSGGRMNLEDHFQQMDLGGGRVRFKPRPQAFEVMCYYVDFDGERYAPYGFNFSIRHFEGEKDITSLPIFPWSYMADGGKLKEDLISRGKSLVDILQGGPKHLHYLGSTIDIDPVGTNVPTDHFDWGERRRRHVDGEVIIDFKETYRQHPNWGNEILSSSVASPIATTAEFQETTLINFWKTGEFAEVDASQGDLFRSDNHIDVERYRQYATTDPFLMRFLGDESAEAMDGQQLGDENVMLLPNRAFGFILQERQFAAFRVDKDFLRPVLRSKTGFNDLQLNEGHKRMIMSLVQTTFMDIEMRRNRDPTIAERLDPDLVKGKGRGLIILLHGAPGVGKTSTAETIAAYLGRPLMPITCGDLGTTPQSVELALSARFEQAEMWNCILLLDEADVFLAARTKADLERNALVSVFLRALEYYTGILFLTTNRVGSFDQAFKSRIHMTLLYPPLDADQTKKIWATNLRRTLERKQGSLIANQDDINDINMFAEKHYTENVASKSTWNGRQIRNAFQTAAALAEFEALEAHAQAKKAGTAAADSSPQPAVLTRRHFEVVADASLEFDLYIQMTNADKTAEEMAEMNAERVDYLTQKNMKGMVKARRNGRGSTSSYPPPFPQNDPLVGGYQQSNLLRRMQQQQQQQQSLPSRQASNSPNPAAIRRGNSPNLSAENLYANGLDPSQARFLSAQNSPQPQMYMPHPQMPMDTMNVAFVTNQGPEYYPQEQVDYARPHQLPRQQQVATGPPGADNEDFDI